MRNIPCKDEINQGQAVYTKWKLRLYDIVVTKFSNRFAWKCPRKILINFFKENISSNHLDIGVGTGYFLRKLPLIPDKQRIGLLDLNKDCLNYAKNSLKKFNPEIYQHDIFEPFTGIVKKFDTISLNYVLHCLPGNMSCKAIAFDHIKEALNPGGKLFGTTILGKGSHKNWLARKLLALYNKKKIMNNLADDYESLLSELQMRFTYVEMRMQGCVAMFIAK